ncbi:MAG TPA: YjjG family noncanonical pyrimidine nucleotidase [Sphingobacteriaceae bacterium]|nr:YjjG family noncanonical pyrimidine nucleotidase [Sphingobacteriaceae bacterium]
MKNRFRHIFFDLDHTIWDFDRNAEETLHELFHSYKLQAFGLHSPDHFIETYTTNNHSLWADYHLGKISKDYLRQARFKKTFTDLGIDPELIPLNFEDDYVRICPTKTNLFPQVHETLTYLYEKYQLHLISNGFKESTEMKVKLTNLSLYFKNVVISEVVGVHKPDKAIFEHALHIAKARKDHSLMIGDSIEADIRGALNFGIEAIYFNPLNKEKPQDIVHQVLNFEQLMTIL